jgi:hypothetical protein
MIFHDDTPATTMDEDLVALGLDKLLVESRRPVQPSAVGSPGISLMEAATAAKPVKPAVKPAPNPAATADVTVTSPNRTEIEVRPEGEETDPDAVVIETIEGVFDFAEAEGFELPEVLMVIEGLNGSEGDLIEGLLSELEEGDHEGFLEDILHEGCDDKDDDEEDDDDDDKKPAFLKKGPKSEAAELIIRTFYEQLDNVSEDDDSRPDYDELVGVIEAYEYVTEQTGLLQEIRFGKKASAAGRGKKRAMKKGKWKRMKRFVAKAHKMGKHFVGGVKMTTGALRRHLMKAKKGAHGRFKRSLQQKLMGLKNSTVGRRPKHAGVEPQGQPISELEQNIEDLKQTVAEGAVDEAIEIASAELIEGLKAVYDASSEWFTKIAEEVKEDKDLSEDDARVAMGRHLEQIAEDAARIAQLIDEGEADIEDAADDLASLGADLDDALEAMKGID